MHDPEDDWLGLLPGDDDGERPRSRRPIRPAGDPDAWLAPPSEAPPGTTRQLPALAPSSKRSRLVRRRRRFVRTAIVFAALVVLLAFAVVPQAARNLSTSVADGDTRISLTSGDDTVTVVAPAGWHIVRPLGSASAVALETPDGLVEISFDLSQRPGAEAPPDVADLAGDEREIAPDAWNVEPPTAGTVATYVELQQPESIVPAGLFGTGLFSDGAPAQPALVAAVTPAPPRASGAVVDVFASSDVPFEPYLAEFAGVVGSLEFAA